MPKITFIEFDGTAHEVDVPAGGSVMEAVLSIAHKFPKLYREPPDTGYKIFILFSSIIF